MLFNSSIHISYYIWTFCTNRTYIIICIISCKCMCVCSNTTYTICIVICNCMCMCSWIWRIPRCRILIVYYRISIFYPSIPNKIYRFRNIIIITILIKTNINSMIMITIRTCCSIWWTISNTISTTCWICSTCYW